MPVRAAVLTLSELENFHHDLDNSAGNAIHFPSGTAISVAAATELACILVSHPNVALRAKVDSQLAACEVWRLFRKTRSAQQSASTSSTRVSRIPRQYESSWLVDEAKLLQAHLLNAGFPKNLSKSITGAVTELLDNVWSHSQTSVSGWLCYQVGARTLTFGVADLGVGVLTSLRRNIRFAGVRTSMTAIEQAIKPGVSGDPNGGGLGLDVLTRSLANLWGVTRLRSGQAALTFDRQSDQHRKGHRFLPELKGFQITAICRLSPPK